MTGVSYMIPFVAAGGLLIALGFLLGGYEIVGPAADIATDNTLFNLPDPSALGLDHALFDSALLAYLGALFFILGETAFGFLVPALAGYIAYAIADRPGIAPGFVIGGWPPTSCSRHADRLPRRHRRRCPRRRRRALDRAAGRCRTWARGLMPVLVIPLFATLIAGCVMSSSSASRSAG